MTIKLELEFQLASQIMQLPVVITLQYVKTSNVDVFSVDFPV